MLVDLVTKAREAFAECDALADDGGDLAIGERLQKLRREYARAAVLGALESDEPGNDRIVEVQPGRGRAADRKGRGIQFMICQQHQRAADQVSGVLVLRRPDARDLQMKRFYRGFGVQ